jgi:hypothetical protein
VFQADGAPGEANDTTVICAYDVEDRPPGRVSSGGIFMDAAQNAGSVGAVDAPELSTRDREILAFERQWWKYAGAKEQAVRELFDMSATRYYQVLNTLIDSRAALAFDPMLVKRLRRMRATRQRARSARRLGIRL